MRMTATIALLGFFAAAAGAQQPAAPPAPRPQTEPLRKQGQAARDAGRYDEATRAFEQALPLSADDATKATTLFDLAVTLQLQGEAENDSALLGEAVAKYREVLALKPDSATTWFNLAKIHDSLEQAAPAREAYSMAAKLGGERPGFFRLQLATFLRAQGDCAAAAPLYLEMALAEDRSREAHDGLVACYINGPLEGDDGFLVYLWRLMAAGDVVMSRQAALAALEGSWPSRRTSRELLTLVAESLGRSYLDPAEFRRSAAATSLERLADSTDGDLAGAARELLAAFGLYGIPPGDSRWRQRFGSWLDAGDRAADSPAPAPHGGVWPRDAITSVLLTLGDWTRQQQQNDLAEAFFRKAADLDPPRVEVRAVERLADLYVGLDQVDQVDRVLTEYGDRLFSEKTQLYAKDAPPEQIYEFHRTLGELYGYLASTGQREWGHRSDPRSASYQLQRAYDKWKEIEAPTRAALDPAVAELLARSYQAESNPAKAAAVRIDAAERLDAKGDARGRDALIRPLDKSTLPVEQKQRLEVLEAKPSAMYDNALTDTSAVASRADTLTVAASKVDVTTAAAPRADTTTAASPKADYVRKEAAKESSIAISSPAALPDIQRKLSSPRSVLTLFTSSLDTRPPEAAAEELATTLAAWLERDTSKASRAAQRSRTLPPQVKSWDGSRGIAVLDVDGRQVEISFQLTLASD